MTTTVKTARRVRDLTRGDVVHWPTPDTEGATVVKADELSHWHIFGVHLDDGRVIRADGSRWTTVTEEDR